MNTTTTLDDMLLDLETAEAKRATRNEEADFLKLMEGWI